MSPNSKWSPSDQFRPPPLLFFGQPTLRRFYQAVKAMLRKMVSKYFQLKLHKEVRVGPIYRPQVAKGGLKIREVAPAHAPVKPGRVNIAAGDQSTSDFRIG